MGRDLRVHVQPLPFTSRLAFGKCNVPHVSLLDSNMGRKTTLRSAAEANADPALGWRLARPRCRPVVVGVELAARAGREGRPAAPLGGPAASSACCSCLSGLRVARAVPPAAVPAPCPHLLHPHGPLDLPSSRKLPSRGAPRLPHSAVPCPSLPACQGQRAEGTSEQPQAWHRLGTRTLGLGEQGLADPPSPRAAGRGGQAGRICSFHRCGSDTSSDRHPC